MKHRPSRTLTDQRNAPAYLMSEAAAYLQVPKSTVRSWAMGHRYRTADGTEREARPLFLIAERQPPTLSFWNLVEIYVLASMTRLHRVPMTKVRKALSFVKRELGVPRPLISESFLTDGAQLFIHRSAKLINLTDPHQLSLWESWIEHSLRRIDADPQGLAVQLYPWKHDPQEPRLVVLDPHRSFGRPLLAGTGIPTGILAERFRGGDSLAGLADDYGLSAEQVETAIRWEHRGEAA